LGYSRSIGISPFTIECLIILGFSQNRNVEFRFRDLFWLKPGVIGVLIFLQLKQEAIDK
jgi:hypothetical protein